MKPLIPIWLDDAGLSLPTFRVFAHYCRRADRETGIAWPSYESVADACGISRATVNRSLKELTARGYLTDMGKPFGGSTRYLVTPPIVSGEARLEDTNSLTPDTIGNAPIVSQEAINRVSGDTPIVSREILEGIPSKGNQRRETKASAKLAPIPNELSSEAFAAAWSEWQQHRIEKKQKLTPTSAKRQLADLAKMGEARAIAAIHYSISKGWQGIFEEKGGTATATTGKTINLGRRGQRSGEYPEPITTTLPRL